MTLSVHATGRMPHQLKLVSGQTWAPKISAVDELTKLAAAILEARRIRPSAILPALFGEVGWEASLELFIVDAGGMSVSGRIVADRSGVPEAVRFRCIELLVEADLVVCCSAGGVADPLALSALRLGQIKHQVA